MQEQGYDIFASVRQCGGPHTLTLPHKKMVKVNQTANSQSIEEITQIPLNNNSNSSTTHK